MDWKRIKWLVAFAGAGVGIVALFLWMRPSTLDRADTSADVSHERSSEQSGASVALPDQPISTTAKNITQPPSPAGRSDVASSVSKIEQPEPSPVWTDEDGRSTNAIRQLAHNEMEVQRMLSENDKIYRRQLVVLKEPVAFVIQQSRLTGESIEELTLQGLDGQKIQFEIQHADIDPSGLQGSFFGHVAGRPNSQVSLAFLKTRQSYIIISPQDNIFLFADPHDPGDVVVKSVNLEKYEAFMCGMEPPSQ